MKRLQGINSWALANWYDPLFEVRFLWNRSWILVTHLGLLGREPLKRPLNLRNKMLKGGFLPASVTQSLIILFPDMK